MATGPVASSPIQLTGEAGDRTCDPCPLHPDDMIFSHISIKLRIDTHWKLLVICILGKIKRLETVV